ncbi:MAG: carbon storage regulator [Bdellovibrionales bacterium]|nr:carbon storage regulator [Bdellovibrionales bacterium]
MLKLKKGKLILTRRQGEGLSIGDNTVITILQIKGKQVRIGIEASKDVKIVRSELVLKNKSTDSLN